MPFPTPPGLGDPIVLAKLYAEHLNGDSIRTLARRYGYYGTTLRRVLQRKGYEINGRAKTLAQIGQDEMTQIRADVRGGASQVDIMRWYNITSAAARQIVADLSLANIRQRHSDGLVQVGQKPRYVPYLKALLRLADRA